MDDMNAELWSRLPEEVMERALLFLSVPVLCRFRTVCKSWNSLISKHGFGALNAQHATKDACFLVARSASGYRYMDDALFEKKHRWSFLDLNTRRWYTVLQDGQESFDRSQRGSQLSMDGGLVCQCLEADVDNEVSIFVCNPVAKTSKRLPTPPHSNRLTHLLDLVVLNMIVDSSVPYYSVFVMPNGEHLEFRSAVNSLLMIYESTTNRWRMPTHPPMRQITEQFIYVQSSVFFDGMLYILMCSHVRHHWLWSYNPDEDTWNDTGVTIDLMLSHPHLLVSDNRLFLGSWLRTPSYSAEVTHRGRTTEPNRNTPRWSFELSKVLLEDRIRTSVFQIAGAVLEDFYPSKIYRSLFGLRALAFYKSIVLICESSGACKVYDLCTCFSPGRWAHILVLESHELDSACCPAVGTRKRCESPNCTDQDHKVLTLLEIRIRILRSQPV